MVLYPEVEPDDLVNGFNGLNAGYGYNSPTTDESPVVPPQVGSNIDEPQTTTEKVIGVNIIWKCLGGDTNEDYTKETFRNNYTKYADCNKICGLGNQMFARYVWMQLDDAQCFGRATEVRNVG